MAEFEKQQSDNTTVAFQKETDLFKANERIQADMARLQSIYGKTWSYEQLKKFEQEDQKRQSYQFKPDNRTDSQRQYQQDKSAIMAEAKQNLDAYNKSGVKSVLEYTPFGSFALVGEADLNKELGNTDYARSLRTQALVRTPFDLIGTIYGASYPVSTLASSVGAYTGGKIGHRYGGETGKIIGDIAGGGFGAGLPYAIGRIGTGLPQVITRGWNYGNNVLSHYRLANIPLNKNEEALRQTLVKNGFTYDKAYDAYKSNPNAGIDWTPDFTNQAANVSGGIFVKPSRMTTELHINPHESFQLLPNGNIGQHISSTPVKNVGRLVEKIASEFPKGTVLTQNKDALSVPQIIQNLPLFNRLNFYLRGRIPSQTVSEVNGYSTDIMRWLVARQKRNGDIVLPSQTTRLNGLNIHGENFGKKFAKYFGKPDENGFVYFKDMTPEQVSSWNKEIAPIYGHYIDPITRTSENLMLITK